MTTYLESLFSDLTQATMTDGGLISMRSSFIGASGGELQAGLDGVYVKHKIIIPPDALVNQVFFVVDDPIDRSIYPFYTQRTAAYWTPSTDFLKTTTLYIEYQPTTDLPPGELEKSLVPLFYENGIMVPVDGNYSVDTVNKVIVVNIDKICDSGTYAVGIAGSTGPDGQVIGSEPTWMNSPSGMW
jgi:hypothetical protein